MWQSADPALDKYLPEADFDNTMRFVTEPEWKWDINLPGHGGIYSSLNLGIYSYAGNNPLRYIDPDGKELKSYKLAGYGNTYFDDKFIPKLEKFVAEAKKNGVTLHFNEAFRPPGKQAEIAANAKNPNPKAKPGQSLHEAGFAVDVNYKSLSLNQQKAIRNAAKASGLSWGGSFKTKDVPHFYFDPGTNRSALVKAAQEKYNELTDPSKKGQ